MNTESLGKKPVQNTIQAVLGSERYYLPRNSCFAERHYRVSDLAELWGLGRETLRKLVKDEPGVIKIRQGRKRRIQLTVFQHQQPEGFTLGC
jgi:hypothetical protein